MFDQGLYYHDAVTGFQFMKYSDFISKTDILDAAAKDPMMASL